MSAKTVARPSAGVQTYSAQRIHSGEALECKDCGESLHLRLGARAT